MILKRYWLRQASLISDKQKVDSWFMVEMIGALTTRSNQDALVALGCNCADMTLSVERSSG